MNDWIDLLEMELANLLDKLDIKLAKVLYQAETDWRYWYGFPIGTCRSLCNWEEYQERIKQQKLIYSNTVRWSYARLSERKIIFLTKVIESLREK